MAAVAAASVPLVSVLMIETVVNVAVVVIVATATRLLKRCLREKQIQNA